MEKNAAVFLEMCSRDRFAPWPFGVKGRSPEHDVLAIERAIALTYRHCRLPRIEPHRREAIRFRVEARDSGPCTLGSVGIEECEIRLKELALLDHVLLTRSLRDDRFSIHRNESLHDVPVAYELGEQLLTGAWRVRRLVLVVGLLRDCRSGDK